MTAEERPALSLLEWGIQQTAKPGEPVSGDMHFIASFENGALVAVVDGLGHGEEAAAAARKALDVLAANPHYSALRLVKLCHEALQFTRGAALTAVSFNEADGTITWLGVGNVEGVLLRSDLQAAPPREYVLLHPGVVGLQLPPLRASVLTYSPGDTLLLATDGIRAGFADNLPPKESPQHLADRIFSQDYKGTDDALVLVARVLGGSA